MNERINRDIAVWRQFTENMLREPEEAFEYAQTYFDKYSADDIRAFFNQIERAYPTCILQDKLILLLLAGSLSNIFYQQKDGDEEDRFSEKMQEIYATLLHNQSQLSDSDKVALTRFVAKAYCVVKDFNSAIAHYESAIALEEKITGKRSPQYRREIFLQLISTCLQMGGEAYSRPAPDLALQFYEKVIQAGENTLTSPIKYRLNQVWGMMAQAQYGLGLLYYQKKNFMKSIDSLITVISNTIQSLQTEMHAYPDSTCTAIFGFARTHAPNALKNIESGSWRLLNLKVFR